MSTRQHDHRIDDEEMRNYSEKPSQRSTSSQFAPQKPENRVLAVLALVLPPVFYVLLMAFSLVTVYTPNYAELPYFNSTGLDAGTRAHASPFYKCTAENDGSREAYNSQAAYNETCVRKPFLGNKGMQFCLTQEPQGAWPDYMFCQQSVMSASLYVAGAILAGVALGGALVFAALAWSTRVGNASAASTPPISATKIGFPLVLGLLRICSALLALLAVICIVGAQAVGIAVLTSTRLTELGDVLPQNMGTWYIGKAALVYSSVAWLSGVLGSFIALTAWF